jgi:serine/threonine protein phosphatase PrpC
MPFDAATAASQFFRRAENLVLETFDAEYVDFENFDERLSHLADDLAVFSVPPTVLLDQGASTALFERQEDQWHVPIGSAEQLALVFGQMFSVRLSAAYDRLTIWWTEGSSIVDPSCLIVNGLPHPDAFAALLDGSWSRYQWRSIPARVEKRGAFDAAWLSGGTPLQFRSVAASDVGKVRPINEDAYIEHPDSGLWAIADGLGGHAHGETASRMVCDAFADFLQTGTFDDTIAAACERIQAVNDQLVRDAARSLVGDRPGSTVAAFLARGSRCAIVWAGDSRVYRWRSGRLARLTRDHTEVESAIAGASPHVVTRAVGVQPRLELDVCREQVRPGDRFLLCSDGLTRTVSDAQIGASMEMADITSAARSLIKATLDAGAPDNVTALVVEAYADAVT